MRDVISEASPAPTSRLLTAGFVVLSLALLWTAFAFVVEVFGAGDPTVLGLNLAAGFALIGLMAVVYYRLFVPHRLVLEHGEDLW
ncbi:MAG: hypothetical protein ABEJ92_05710 [Halobacteriales archaeon]